MSNYSLIQFGNYILSNQKWGVNAGTHYSSSPKDTQVFPHARSSGVNVVNTRDEARDINITGYALTRLTGMGITDELNSIFNNDNQLYRVIPSWTSIFTPTTTTGITLGSDAINLGVSNTDIQIGNTSILFDIDVSNSANNYAEITHTATNPVNISSYTNTGNIELALKIPDAKYITSIDVRIGNDSSNYYGYTFLSNYQGEWDYGWNWLSIPLGNGALPSGQDYNNKIAETGTVDDTLIDYMYIKINYSSNAIDITGCAFGGLIWVDEKKARNYPCYVKGSVQMTQTGGNNNSIMPYSVNLLNYTGYSRATHEITIYEYNNLSTTTITESYIINGSGIQQPKWTVDVVSAGGISNISLADSRGGNTVTFNPLSVATGDQFVFGGVNKEFTKNEVNINFTGKLPEFFEGINRTTLNLNESAVYSISQPSGSEIVTGTNTVSTLYNVNSSTINRAWISQAISIPTAGNIASVSLVCENYGGVGNSISLQVFNNSAGETGTRVANTSDVNVTLTTPVTYTWVPTATSPVTTGTHYLYFRSESASTQWTKIYGRKSNVYTGGGVTIYNTGVTSTGIIADLWFNVYLSTNYTAVANVSHTYYPIYR